MKTSELIVKLQKSLELVGDVQIKKCVIHDEHGVEERNLLSPDRNGKHGQRLNMNWKEFDVYVKEQKAKE